MKRLGLVPASKVLALLRDADRHGKHGRIEDAGWYRVGIEPYVLFDAPIDRLNHEYYDTETGEFSGMSAHQERRVARYARMRGTPPPIRLSYRAGHSGGKAFIADGNHRTEVAKRAGRKTIRALMPLSEFRAWSATMRNPFKRRVSGKRSKQAESARPSNRTRYKSKHQRCPMAKRRRQKSPLTKVQKNALRALMRAAGMRVGKKRRVKAKRRKARRVKFHRVKSRRVARRIKAPKRLHSGTKFRRKGRKFVVVSYVVRRGGKKVRVRFARRA